MSISVVSFSLLLLQPIIGISPFHNDDGDKNKTKHPSLATGHFLLFLPTYPVASLGSQEDFARAELFRLSSAVTYLRLFVTAWS